MEIHNQSKNHSVLTEFSAKGFNPQLDRTDIRESPIERAGHDPTETDLILVDSAHYYGDEHDGVIEAAPRLIDNERIEIGYYFGDDKPKSIIKVSSQVGCPSQCDFCEVGEERLKRNLNWEEIFQQVLAMAQVSAAFGVSGLKKPHKVSFAGTGEPLSNPEIVKALHAIASLRTSFKLSTVYPKGENTVIRLREIAKFANSYSESVQLQISLISTDERFRSMSAGKIAASFSQIRAGTDSWFDAFPNSRKINMSLILTDSTPADPNQVLDLFPPERFRFRFRCYVPTLIGTSKGLKEISQERLHEIKANFRASGYEVYNDATPTPTEWQFGLASNVTRRREIAASRSVKI